MRASWIAFSLLSLKSCVLESYTEENTSGVRLFKLKMPVMVAMALDNLGCPTSLAPRTNLLF